MKSLIMLTLFFCTNFLVPSLVSATVFSKNQHYSIAVPTKKKAYKERVVTKFLQLKSKFKLRPDKKLVWITLIEAVVCLVVGLSLFSYDNNDYFNLYFWWLLAEVLPALFGVFLMIFSAVLFIIAAITAFFSSSATV